MGLPFAEGKLQSIVRLLILFGRGYGQPRGTRCGTAAKASALEGGGRTRRLELVALDAADVEEELFDLGALEGVWARFAARSSTA